jgi:NAD(P)-dependent dehydrogenase (short-subunit alcohol dehydrogenase family)
MSSVLITGASRGLGLEFARQYAVEGWRVIATCRDVASASELLQLSEESELAIQVLALDVTDIKSISSVAAKLDGYAIDILLNNAGIDAESRQKIGACDYKSWMRMFDTNSVGPVRISEAFLEHVAKSERKLMVTISSGMASIAQNDSGGSMAYRSSKAAVNMAMRSFAIDSAHFGISSILVSPGWVSTDMGGAGATLTPAESVAALRHLMENFSIEHSGKFFDFEGSELPW